MVFNGLRRWWRRRRGLNNLVVSRAAGQEDGSKETERRYLELLSSM